MNSKWKYAAALFFAVFFAYAVWDNFSAPIFQKKSFEEQKEEAVRRIPDVFLKSFSQLSAEKQGHFLVRLYRFSGDAVYLPGIRSYAERLTIRFKNHAQNLDNPEYIQQTASHFLTLPEKPLIKHRYRSRIRSTWPEMAFAHRLLFLAFQIKSFSMDRGAEPEFEKNLKFLSSLSYESYLLNEDVIRYNSTRSVNMIYQLKYLGLGDYENAFLEKFKSIFFSKPDPLLDRTLYLNKMYGLTHWIIAASDFYQHPVPYEKSKWVLDYFEENLDTILVRNSPDTIAEVAVCFKLAGQNDHPAVRRIQEFLLKRFDAKRGYIPSDHTEFTLDGIEHRNILSWMALKNWTALYAGPSLD